MKELGERVPCPGPSSFENATRLQCKQFYEEGEVTGSHCEGSIPLINPLIEKTSNYFPHDLNVSNLENPVSRPGDHQHLVKLTILASYHNLSSTVYLD